MVLVDTTGGSVTITLPKAVYHAKRVYTIKNIGTGSVTIKVTNGDKMDDLTSLVLGLQFSYVTFVSNKVDKWFIIGGMNVKLEDVLLEILSLAEKDKKVQEKILKQLEKINS